MALPLHSDGCIVANIPVKPYSVRFEPKCPHTKMRSAVIVINARTADEAMQFADKWIALAQLIPVDVTEMPIDNNAKDVAIALNRLGLAGEIRYNTLAGEWEPVTELLTESA